MTWSLYTIYCMDISMYLKIIFFNNPVINTTISTRCHGFKLKATLLRFDITKKHFCNRVASTWNILLERIVNLISKVQFKKALRTVNFESATKFDRHL